MFHLIFLSLVLLAPADASHDDDIDGIFVWKNYPLPIGVCVPFKEKEKDVFVDRSYRFSDCTDTRVKHTVFKNNNCHADNHSDPNDPKIQAIAYHDHDKGYTKLIHCHKVNKEHFGLVDVHIIKKFGTSSTCETLVDTPEDLLPERTLKLVTNMCVENPEPGAVKHKWVECADGVLFEMYASKCMNEPLDSYSIVTTDCSPMVAGEIKTAFSIKTCTKPFNEKTLKKAPITNVSAAPSARLSAAAFLATLLTLFFF